ncbi:MAG: pectin esterase [Alistipes sp.]|nr:pectin esterase [Alistipes sp.]
MAAAAVALFAFAAASAADGKTTIFLVGDSTCATKSLDKQNPERGWGHMFQPFFDSSIVVENHAVNGRSTKSFRDEGRWDKVLETMKSDDYVFIEFGHNDQKEKDPKRFSTPEQYAENLRAFIFEVRGNGGTPVLLTPIVRRHWDNGRLLDTHGEYVKQVKRIAEEEEVIMFDMEADTRRWVTSLGDEASRDYFMWVAPGTCPLYPDGRQDDTHLNVKGARIVAGMVADHIAEAIPELAEHLVRYDFVVAKDGSGDFFTVGEMIDAVPNFAQNEINVLIRNGVYKEKNSISSTKRHLHLTGESVEGTVITYDDFASRKGPVGNLGTSGSSSLYICCDDFTAENITFENSAGSVGQAVAVQCIGDRMVFRNCRFLGNQDTLYLHGYGNREGKEYVPNSRIYFVDCYVEGTTDFIFGSATALFENCRIHSKSNSMVTAASTCKGQPYGFVFRNCDFTANDGVDKVRLGRPWRDYAQTVLIDCRLGGHIMPEGWHNWNRPEAEKTVLYGEYGSTGEGANAKSRVAWSKKLDAATVKTKYTKEAILGGTDGWNPEK